MKHSSFLDALIENPLVPVIDTLNVLIGHPREFHTEAMASVGVAMGSAGNSKDEMKKAEEKGDEEARDEKAQDQGQSLFNEGDKVLAYHGPLIYEAKVRKVELRKKEWKYFVHYLGWSKNWDEWVGTDRLMALTDANPEIQMKLFKNQNADKQLKGRISQVAKGKKRKAEVPIEEKEMEEPDHIMKIPLPAILKKQLVDDWELIQSGKSIKLPRRPNVDEILKMFREFKSKRESTVEDLLGEVLSGLQTYFDKSLPAMLLYKQERSQYAEAVPQGSSKPPSLIYGAEHLLRLFVKLPELLVYTNMEEETMMQLQQKLMEFLKFLQKNQANFFLSVYDGPTVSPVVEMEEKKQKRGREKGKERTKVTKGQEKQV